MVAIAKIRKLDLNEINYWGRLLSRQRLSRGNVAIIARMEGLPLDEILASYQRYQDSRQYCVYQ